MTYNYYQALGAGNRLQLGFLRKRELTNFNISVNLSGYSRAHSYFYSHKLKI